MTTEYASMTLPYVSICTVTYNRHEFLPILQEIILAQDYPLNYLQWVLIDDSDKNAESFDPDPAINTSIIRLDSKIPLGKKRNISHKYSDGDIIVYMDDDDFYPETRVSHAVDVLMKTDSLIAGCTVMPILFLPEGELWISGPFMRNHATANTFAFKRQIMSITSYNNSDISGEEKYFLKNYSIPLVQLDPQQTIIHLSHFTNTIDKRNLQAPTHSKLKKVTTFKRSDYQQLIDKYNSIMNLDTTSKLSYQPYNVFSNTVHWSAESSWKLVKIRQCIYINLSTNHDRNIQIKSQLSEHGLNSIRFTAITPDTLPKIQANSQISNTPEQLACLASHLFVMRLISQNIEYDDNDSFLILEDDAILRSVFNPAPYLTDLPENWDIIQLGTNNPNQLTLLQSFKKLGYNFIRWHPRAWGTFGYLINKKAANKIASKFLKPNNQLCLINTYMPGRIVSDDLLYSEVNTYSSCDSIIAQDPRFVSDIGYDQQTMSLCYDAWRQQKEYWDLS